MKTKLTSQEQFFFDNAGYSYDPKKETAKQGKLRCARELATAERYIADNTEWNYFWEYDEDGCSGCDCKNPDCDCFTGAEHETLVCLLKDESNNVLACLSGICSPTTAYRRVIEAELAEEAIADYRKEGARVNA